MSPSDLHIFIIDKFLDPLETVRVIISPTILKRLGDRGLELQAVEIEGL